MKSYEVLGNINSGRHKAGDIVEFSDSEAVVLLKADLIRALPEKPLLLVNEEKLEGAKNGHRKKRT